MIEQDTKIIFNKKLTAQTCLMALESPEVVAEARPGQFLMIRVRPGIDPILRRPFSICGTRGHNLFLIIYKVVGRGTAFLSEAGEGERLSVLGPLGRGFELPKRAGESVLVAGGIGIAPLIFLAQTMEPTNMTFMTGYRSANEILPMDKFSLDTFKVFISTDDGTAGHHGPVTELIENHLAGCVENPPMVFACGPTPMLKCVADLTIKRDIPCQVSQETAMACGLGACQGCAVRASSEENRTYYHVCQDGPVFDVQKLDWKAL
jgi:dihydroorotate dehydrogenase electron transfer subunit